MNELLTISGTGCCLVDRIYPEIDFSSPVMAPFLSRSEGDGGLVPGRLVFSEPFEAFSGRKLPEIIGQISSGHPDPILNVGGPSIVALIHAAQLLQGSSAKVEFYGVKGSDEAGKYLQGKLERTPVRLAHFETETGATASTIVLSDPSYHEGEGERMFINEIGASWKMGPDRLDASFFASDVVVFGGTALVPRLHDHLTDLLERSRKEGAITVVNTVFDFRSEQLRPGKPWRLGESGRSYSFIDLLITDSEEALRLSGAGTLTEASKWFIGKGVSSFAITNGTADTWCYSDGRLFHPLSLETLPVSADLVDDLKRSGRGDTTGCGDNFVGGMLASLAWQLRDGEKPDLQEAVSWGTVSGGYCCFHVGGTLLEEEPGEKLNGIRPYYEKYRQRLHD